MGIWSGLDERPEIADIARDWRANSTSSRSAAA
jgi:hypothetical protein